MTPIADIWFKDTLAAHFTRDGDQTTFSYTADYAGPRLPRPCPSILIP
ncbi:hypothetical protein [Corynebacterium glutamicum]|nr:hypothetical protein [Corynebacterium glutamicum]